MISKKYYQELLSDNPQKRDYTKTIVDLFNYIIESKINGNYQQTKEFIKRLNKEQFFTFLNYCESQEQNAQEFNKMRLFK